MIYLFHPPELVNGRYISYFRLKLFQAQEEQKKKYGGGFSFPGGMPGGGSPGGGMPDLGNLFKDPEILAAMQVILAATQVILAATEVYTQDILSLIQCLPYFPKKASSAGW